MKFQQLTTMQTYPLRQLVLRPNRPLSACQFPDDDQFDTYHFGLVDPSGEVIAIVTFLATERGHQLRGMAAHPNYQNLGLGSTLLRDAYDALQVKGITQVWCQARVRAIPFYERLGFVSDETIFEVPDVGPHVTMKWIKALECRTSHL